MPSENRWIRGAFEKRFAHIPALELARSRASGNAVHLLGVRLLARGSQDRVVVLHRDDDGSISEVRTQVVPPWSEYHERAMNRWRDIVDWIGGYPYEVATPEAVFEFCRERGFALFELRCGGVGLGCNEFVFERT
jgi:hypothetical protein